MTQSEAPSALHLAEYHGCDREFWQITTADARREHHDRLHSPDNTGFRYLAREHTHEFDPDGDVVVPVEPRSSEHEVSVNETVSYNIQLYSVVGNCWLTETHREKREHADVMLNFWKERYDDGVRLQKVTMTTVRTEQVL